MAVMTSTLILSLIDRVTAPARGIEATLKRLQNAQANNTRRLNEVRGQMMDAVGAAYALYKGLSAPLNAAAKFKGVLCHPTPTSIRAVCRWASMIRTRC